MNRSVLQRVVGGLMLLAGISVFAIRLQHAGPYDPPEGGNLAGGMLSLAIGGWLVRDWLGPQRLARPLATLALLASPLVLFFALYATLAELEEVVAMRATDRSGQTVDLRLWIVDEQGASWITMPRSKADEHGLDQTQVELLRGGERKCQVVERLDDRAAANRVYELRRKKYAVQRIATMIGLFGDEAGSEQVALRLTACP